MKGGKNDHFARAIARQNGQIWPILTWPQKFQKEDEKRFKNIIELPYAKDGLEKKPNTKNDTFFKGGKNGQFGKAIARQNGQNWPVLGWP